VVAVVGMVFALAVGNPAYAQESYVDGLIQGPDIQGGDAPTVAERYPVTSYRYPFHGEGIAPGAQAQEVVDLSFNGIATLLILLAGYMAQGASKLVQWALDTTTTAWLLDAVEGVLAAMADAVLGQLVLGIVFLGALWVAWQGIRQRAASAMSGVVWMVVVIAVGAVFVSQPRTFIEAPHNMTTELSASLFGAVASAGIGGGGDGYYGDTPPSFSGPAATDAQRRLEDQLWRVMVFEPWRVSTFPTAAMADEYAERLLADPSQDTIEDIYAEIGDADEDAAEQFAGRRPLDRVVASSITFLAALPIVATMVVLGASLIVLQYAFVLLSLLFPLFALVGIHPGGGRNAMLRWLDMWIGTLVKRIAVTAIISALVSLFGFAAANLRTQGWFLTVILTTLVCVAALVYRRTITDLLASAAGFGMSGEEGKREHAARAHPGRSMVRAAVMAKSFGVGAFGGAIVGSRRAEQADQQRRAARDQGARRANDPDARRGDRATTEPDVAGDSASEDTGTPGTTAARPERNAQEAPTQAQAPGTAPDRSRPVDDPGPSDDDAPDDGHRYSVRERPQEDRRPPRSEGHGHVPSPRRDGQEDIHTDAAPPPRRVEGSQTRPVEDRAATTRRTGSTQASPPDAGPSERATTPDRAPEREAGQQAPRNGQAEGPTPRRDTARGDDR